MKQIIVDNIETTYYITEDGKCYNSLTNNWLKGQINYKNGYLSYTIKVADKKKRLYAHRLVAIAYIPNHSTDCNQINHKDGNKLNNTVENLEWVNAKQNQQHAIETGLRQFNKVYCFNRDKKLIAVYKSVQEASKAVKVSPSIILGELHKDMKALSGGFYWSLTPELTNTIEYKNLGKAKEVNQYDLNGKYIMTYPSTGIAAKAINGGHCHISECCRGKIKTYKGFIWRYTDDIVLTSLKEDENN